MTDQGWPAEGRTACVVGVGLNRLVHYHTTVEKVTATQIVTGNGRFRRDDFSSIPYKMSGGTVISSTCQRRTEANT